MKKRWKNLKDYENSKKKATPKRAKKTTGKGRSSEDDGNLIEKDVVDDEDDDGDFRVDKTDDTDMSFLGECSTQRSTIGNIDDINIDVNDLEIVTTDADSMVGMIISETGEIIASGTRPFVSEDLSLDSYSTQSRQSPFPLPKSNKRKKQQKDDAYIAIMREKTEVLKELASISSALNVAYNRESNEKSITQQYFDVFSAEIALLPIELQSKCQREVHQVVFAIIHKFQDQAEEIKKAAEK